jgi:carbonic anhydrase
MKTILEGVLRYEREVIPRERILFERMASGQSPEALLITCADSRIVPSFITQTRPGDLFICRNAGNMVPPYEENTGGVSATIEYAVRVLNVQHIVVCGHSDCGAMKAVLHPEMVAEMRAVAAWMRNGEVARMIVEENYADLRGKEQLDMLAQQNALAQLAHLRTHPCVAAREAAGRLQLHAWFYELETGRVLIYSEESKVFVPLRHDLTELAAAAAASEANEGGIHA